MFKNKLNYLPKGKRTQQAKYNKYALIGLVIVAGVAVLWQPQSADSLDPSSTTIAAQPASEATPTFDAADMDPNAPEFQLEQDELALKLDDGLTVFSYAIGKNDNNLQDILIKHGLNLSLDYENVISAFRREQPKLQSDRKGGYSSAFRFIDEGMFIEWVVETDQTAFGASVPRINEISIYDHSKQRKYRFERNIALFDFNIIDVVGNTQQLIVAGEVTTTFYDAALQAGLSNSQIKQLVSMLQWRFDFSEQVHEGDRFAVSLEKEFFDGRAIGHGRVLGFTYQSKDGDLTAMRHADGYFYDNEGQSMEDGFSRLPLEKSFRISSHFNPRRVHPITGQVRAHKGTDFAVPRGTNVLTTASGTVVKSEYHYAAGNYIVIRHGRDYMTRYLHLDERLVEVGDEVAIGQKIGLSGNTGRSTGPHLHYELIHRNSAVNAMTFPLPNGVPLKELEKDVFITNLQKLQTALLDAINSQLRTS
uniref:peptidoglycan DD-metalloendopeptidase family protein n=1 Tax=Thaumasiovibrio occultus TaxID=1891184 RepID=UPI000B34F843|nr:peptidoglycan DD-metalloendopeptidase family protein [Thaumasiovibrio occultus]